MYDPKKIDIQAYNVTAFVKKFGKETSIQRFCNELLDEYLQGLYIKLTSNNLTEVDRCAEAIGRDSSFVVNSVLERMDFTPIVKPEKIKIEVSPIKQKLKVMKKTTPNKVSNW